MNHSEFKGSRTDSDGVTGAVFGPAGVDFPWRTEPTGAADRSVAVNSHDAEEALRPYLGVVYEIDRTVERHSIYVPPEAVLMDLRDQATALRSALDKALDLLQVQR